MRVGLISDVHANKIALDRVLEDMPPVEELVCAGDVIGYNPWPRDCLELIRAECDVVVQGNHDRTVDTPAAYSANRMAYEGLIHAKTELSADQLEWLADLPLQASAADGRLKIVHTHPPGSGRYVRPPGFSSLRERIDDHEGVVLGHTHIQGQEAFPTGFVVNPGSVGQPRDSDPKAAYAVYDTQKGELNLHRVSYDIEAVRDAVNETTIPERTGTRLLDGQ